VDALRRVRREARTGEIVRLNATDPLNLAGIILPGARVPAVHTNAIIFRDGVPVAVEEGKRLGPRPEAPEEALEGIALPGGRSASLTPA
jgi:ATP-dependent Lhr-like helicase